MQRHSIYEIIDKKKKNKVLTPDEIRWTVDSLMNKSIHDYQMSALLMAAFINGLDPSETASLTDAMLYSGKTLTFDGPEVVDKHSTGGVGDKATFILAPIASSCGVKVPMIAGRGLGHTGGTIDKVESIPGIKTRLSLNEFEKLLNKNRIVLIGQTEEIAPADKIIYGLRDVTATIDSIPLITASIMSKKLAEGANGIVMDIKCGSGAFMRKKSEARSLARSILKTAKRFDKKAVALITDMNQPLGNCVGNAIEMKESIETLKGNGPKDLETLSIALAANMIHIAGITKSYRQAQIMAKKSLHSGAALKEFKRLIESQGGDKSYIEDPQKFTLAPVKTEVQALKSGHIKSFKNDEIGLFLTELGGGRKRKDDKIDLSVGLNFKRKIGSKVKEGDCIFEIYHHPHQEEVVNYIKARFYKNVLKMSKTKTETPKIIIEKIEQ